MNDYTPRRYYAFFKFIKDEVGEWETRFTKALNFVANEKSSVASHANDYAKLFELGVEATEQKRKDSGESPRSAAIAFELRRIRQKKSEHKMLSEIYEARGLDDFVIWCEANDITDWDVFIEEYNTNAFQKRSEMSWAQKAQEWLYNILENGPLQLDQVKTRAIVDGIIDSSNFEQEWKKLSVTAHREEMTGRDHAGEWRLPE